MKAVELRVEIGEPGTQPADRASEFHARSDSVEGVDQDVVQRQLLDLLLIFENAKDPLLRGAQDIFSLSGSGVAFLQNLGAGINKAALNPPIANDLRVILRVCGVRNRFENLREIFDTADLVELLAAIEFLSQRDRVDAANAAFVQPHHGGKKLLMAVGVEVIRLQHVADFVDRFVHQQDAAQHTHLGFEILGRQLPLKTTSVVGTGHRSPPRNIRGDKATAEGFGPPLCLHFHKTLAEVSRTAFLGRRKVTRPLQSPAWEGRPTRRHQAFAADAAAADGTTHTLTSVSISAAKCSLTVYIPSSFSGPSSRMFSGSTTKLAALSALLMSIATIEPYKCPSGVALASSVTLYLLTAFANSCTVLSFSTRTWSWAARCFSTRRLLASVATVASP